MYCTPKYFWRRLFAFIIDYGLLLIILAILFASLQPFIKARIQVPSALEINKCGQISDLGRFKDTVALMEHGKYRGLPHLFCSIYNMGFLEKNYLTLKVGYQEGNANYTKAINILVDNKTNLEPVPLLNITPIIYLISPLIIALFYRFFGNTPGKKITKLHLQTLSTKERPSKLFDFVKREYLKAFIYVAYALFAIGNGWIYISGLDVIKEIENIKELSPEATNFGVWFLIWTAGTLLVLSPYYVSFFRWRGAMFYDKMFGFEVRENQDPVNAEHKNTQDH